MLRQHRPDREVLQTPTLPTAVSGERRLPARRTRHREDDLQRLALRLPGPVPVHRGRPGQPDLQVDPELVDLVPLLGRGQRVLGNAFHPQIDRVDEAAAGRQVGRGLHRRPRLGGVQRVDQHEIGAVLGGGPDREILQVVQVADAPGLLRADAVELRRPPPGAASTHPGREAEPGRGDDQRHRPDLVPGSGLQRVIAQGQVSGDLEGGLAHPLAVDLPGRGPVLQLPQVSAALPGLQLQPDLDRVTVGHVHPDRGGPLLPQGQEARQHLGPRPAPLLLQRGHRRLRGGTVDPERGQHRDDRVPRHRDVLALPVPVLGGDAERLGQFVQCRIQFGHGDILAGVHRRAGITPTG